jgi:type II secretory pathway pseudopilin PulG
MRTTEGPLRMSRQGGRLSSSAVSHDGFSLIEVLLAAGILAFIGYVLSSLLRGGVVGTSRAGEVQLAAVLASRAMDVELARGYDELETQVGRSEEIFIEPILAQVGPMQSRPGGTSPLPFTGRVEVQQVRPDLLRVTIVVEWWPAGTPTRQPGRLGIVRLVANPARWMVVRR